MITPPFISYRNVGLELATMQKISQQKDTTPQLQGESTIKLEETKFKNLPTLNEQVYRSFFTLYQILGIPDSEDATAQDTLRLIKDGAKLEDIIPESQQDPLAEHIFKKSGDWQIKRYPRGISYDETVELVIDSTRWKEEELKAKGLEVTEATSHLLFLKLISSRELKLRSHQEERAMMNEAALVNFIYDEIKPAIREWFPKYPESPILEEISEVIADFIAIPENRERMEALNLQPTEATPYFFKLKYDAPHLFDAKLAPAEAVQVYTTLSRVYDIFKLSDREDAVALDTLSILVKDNEITRFSYPFEQDKFANYLHENIGKIIIKEHPDGLHTPEALELVYKFVTEHAAEIGGFELTPASITYLRTPPLEELIRNPILYTYFCEKFRQRLADLEENDLKTAGNLPSLLIKFIEAERWSSYVMAELNDENRFVNCDIYKKIFTDMPALYNEIKSYIRGEKDPQDDPYLQKSARKVFSLVVDVLKTDYEKNVKETHGTNDGFEGIEKLTSKIEKLTGNKAVYLSSDYGHLLGKHYGPMKNDLTVAEDKEKSFARSYKKPKVIDLPIATLVLEDNCVFAEGLLETLLELSNFRLLGRDFSNTDFKDASDSKRVFMRLEQKGSYAFPSRAMALLKELHGTEDFPKLMIVDIELPEQYGTDFIREANKEFGIGTIEFIVVMSSTIDEHKSKIEALEQEQQISGAFSKLEDDFLKKLFDSIYNHFGK